MRPTYLEVNLSQLKQNLENIRKHVSPAKVLVVLKANAYGHGVDGVAPFIAPFADYIGVAIVEEGIHLRKMGVATPILVMGGTLPEQLPDFFEYDLTLAASSLDLLTAAEQLAESLIEKSMACSHLEMEGIFTHFANSESHVVASSSSAKQPPSLTRRLLRREEHPPRHDIVEASLQLERFEEVLSIYEKRSEPHPPIRHTANSGAALLLPESHYDMVRPGILFYGVYPAREIEKNIDVKPALTWKSKVAYSKVTLPGRAVSYGSLWQAGAGARRLP